MLIVNSEYKSLKQSGENTGGWNGLLIILLLLIKMLI